MIDGQEASTAQPRVIRVLIVADNAMTVRAIGSALRHAPDCVVLGAVGGAETCVNAFTKAAPDVILIDDMGTRSDALARIAEARSACPQAKTILLATNMEPASLADAAAAGVDSAISKNLSPDGLATLVCEVAAGTVFHAFRSHRRTVAGSPAASGLTTRELQILRLVAAGRSNGDIAVDLFVTEQTVKFHLSNVYRKLGVSNRTEASHHAFVHGLVEFEPRPHPIPLERAA